MKKLSLNKEKVENRLATLDWVELDWIEQRCRYYKESAGGGRFYSNRGDVTHQREAVQALKQHFDDVYSKHHGIM